MCTCGTNVVSTMLASRASTWECSLEYDGEQQVVPLEEKHGRVYAQDITLRGHVS